MTGAKGLMTILVNSSNFMIRMAQKRTWWLWMLVSAIIIAADQATKYAIVTLTPHGASYPLTPFFNLVHVWNRGAAFSFLADAGGWQRYAFIALGICISTALAVMLYRGLANRLEATAYALVIGGALGNVSDRISRGYVVDYLDFHWQGWHWPAFNIADIAITTGAVLLITASLRGPDVSADQASTHSRSD